MFYIPLSIISLFEYIIQAFVALTLILSYFNDKRACNIYNNERIHTQNISNAGSILEEQNFNGDLELAEIVIKQ